MDASDRAGLVLGVVAGAATFGASKSSSSSDDSSELLKSELKSLWASSGLYDLSAVGRLDGDAGSSLGGVVDRSIDLVAHSSMLLANPGGFAPSISSS